LSSSPDSLWVLCLLWRPLRWLWLRSLALLLLLLWRLRRLLLLLRGLL